jgi:hypothetical protein
MYDAFCHDGGMMGSAAILVDGTRLGVDEPAKNPRRKKKVRVLSKQFKVRNTGDRETHETL